MNASDRADALEPTRRISAEASPDPMIGRRVIGQYQIEKKLGSGGMGTVYLAQQTTVSRPAVIKVLKSQNSGSSESAARFAVEAKAASSLNHPNIVTIYNYGEMEDGTLFLAMEYIAGETLADRLGRCGQLPVARAVHITTQIARALGEAHARGVVHRDLKPQNVMLVDRSGDPDFVKVLDFGIAKLDDASVTSAGYVVGTPRYMSPEQLLGKKIDFRSDIYSAAIVLYEMLAGVTPFQSETPIGWMHQHVDVAPLPPSALSKRGKIPAQVERVVLRALAKGAGDRPPSMEMFALDLAAALNAPAEPLPPPRWHRVVIRVMKLAVAVMKVFAIGTRRALCGFAACARQGCLAISRGVRGTWKLVRTLGSGARHGTRALGSVSRSFGRSVRSVLGGSKRSNRPIAVITHRRGAHASVGSTAGHRLLIAVLVVLATIAMLVALFPEVRADFGLDGESAILKAQPTQEKRNKNH